MDPDLTSLHIFRYSLYASSIIHVDWEESTYNYSILIGKHSGSVGAKSFVLVPSMSIFILWRTCYFRDEGVMQLEVLNHEVFSYSKHCT